MLSRFLGLAVLAMSSAATAAAAASEPKQPTGKWTVETHANECLLIRSYGTPRNPLFLVISQAPMDAGVAVRILYNREWAVFDHGTATVRFDGGEPIEASFGARLLWNLSKEVKTRTMRMVGLNKESESEKFLRNAAAVAFDVPGELKVVFALPDHTEALRSLDDCARNLGVRWGYPLDEQLRIVTPPKRDKGLRSLFSPDDYPIAAMKAGRMGKADVRLRVGENGSISECSILRSSGSADLDTVTCKVLNERAKFEPARDVDGKAVRGIVVTSIQWIMI